MLNILWYFLIYAFLGWCTEVVYKAVKTGKSVNAGFLNGPICPIYGIGVIMVLYFLDPIKGNVIYLFIGSIIITSGVELIGGFLLEKVFHHRWWNYSNMPFNIGGYICPTFSLVWGLSCLVVVDRIHPLFASIVDWIPHAASIVLIIVFACLFILDLTATIKSILKLNKKLEIIDEITLKIREASDNIGENIAAGTNAIVHKKDDFEESFEEKKEVLEANITKMRYAQQKAWNQRKHATEDLHKANKELLEASTFGQKRLLKAFPRVRSIKYKEALEKLKNERM